MSIRNYLVEQIEKHPSMQFQDVVKLCYQAAFGAEHLLGDLERARNYLEHEFEKTDAAPGELYENISAKVCRVNLSAWKEQGLPIGQLFEMFVASATINEGGMELFLGYLEAAEEVLRQRKTVEEMKDWQKFMGEYREAGMPSIHHSETYREKEKPAYRIVKREYMEKFCVCAEVKEN